MLARKLRNYEEYDYDTASTQEHARGLDAEDTLQDKTFARVRYNIVLRRQVALMVLTTLLFAFYMVMRSDVFIQNGYELTKLKSQEVELTKKIEYLQVNLAKAKAPDRIVSLAEKLGMTAAERNIYVKAGGAGETEKVKKEQKEIAAVWN